jgi:hypothetical protein
MFRVRKTQYITFAQSYCLCTAGFDAGIGWSRRGGAVLPTAGAGTASARLQATS